MRLRGIALIATIACALTLSVPANAPAAQAHATDLAGTWSCASPQGGASVAVYRPDGSGTIVTTGAVIHWRYAAAGAQRGTLSVAAPDGTLAAPVRWRSQAAYEQLNPFSGAVMALCRRKG
jgi:hypothetical protein